MINGSSHTCIKKGSLETGVVCLVLNDCVLGQTHHSGHGVPV